MLLALVLLSSFGLYADAQFKVTVTKISVLPMVLMGCRYDIPYIHLGVGIACQLTTNEVVFFQETQNISLKAGESIDSDESFSFDYDDILKGCFYNKGKEIYLALFVACMENSPDDSDKDAPHKAHQIIDKKYPKEIFMDVNQSPARYRAFGKDQGVNAEVLIERL